MLLLHLYLIECLFVITPLFNLLVIVCTEMEVLDYSSLEETGIFCYNLNKKKFDELEVY